MNHSGIVKLSDLDDDRARLVTELLVDSFFPMFQGISKDRALLYRLFGPCLQPDLVDVLLQDGQIAGFVAASGCRQRAVVIRKDICIHVFGRVKGWVLAKQLHKLLSVPAVTEQTDGYIDFIATAPEFKRRGVAAALLAHVEQTAGYSRLYLDVITTNLPAIRLYEKVGYTVDTMKTSIWMRLARMKPMYIMKKELS